MAVTTDVTSTTRVTEGRPVMVAAYATGVVLLDLPERRPLGVAELLVVSGTAADPEADLSELAGRVGDLTGADPTEIEDLARSLAPRLHAAPGVAVSSAGEGDAHLSDQFVLPTPLVLRVTPGGFEALAHDGRVLLNLGARDVAALPVLATPRERDAVGEAYAELELPLALDATELADLVARLGTAGLLDRYDPSNRAQVDTYAPDEREMRLAVARDWHLRDVIKRRMAEHDAAESERAQRTGVTRIKVTPAHFSWKNPPVAIGMIMAYALLDDEVTDHFDLRPDWYASTDRIPSADDGWCIYLFSHYVWNSQQNLEFSARLKAANPLAITVHGGPDVPKYESDVVNYLEAHPHVDVVVRGEGEITTVELLRALAGAERGGPVDLARLDDVAGLTYRHEGRVVRTAERERMTELDVIPSPYLTGLFDGFVEAWDRFDGESFGMGLFGSVNVPLVILETNRGCPYGCTFCDWGSATTSRLRKFSIDRVFAELDWCAENHVEVIGLADSNFGIWERDVDITERVATLRKAHGYPIQFGVSYAKNTVKHLRKIVDLLVDAEILAVGQLSLQTLDADTLEAVNRSNIKIEKYEELAAQFRRAHLPLYVELMMGLPGATVESFQNDLQECVDRDLNPKIYATYLLVNSPMNEPDYRKEHGIEARPGHIVTSSASFTRSDYEHMTDLRELFLLSDKFGMLRQVTCYARQETGIREIDLLERLRTVRDERAAEFPMIAYTLDVVPTIMTPPASWQPFYDEIRRWMVDDLGIADDSALDTVISVQHALMPAHDRTFPYLVDLAHDYVAWHAATIEAKDGGHLRTWPDVTPRLRDFAPGQLSVADAYDICDRALGRPFDSDVYSSWELDSPVSRATIRPMTASS